MNPLSHLPKEKQQEILAAVEIIKEEANPEKIILFGSHATGKWVDSSYVEDGIKISYINHGLCAFSLHHISREECEELIAKLTRMKAIEERICTDKIASLN